MPKCVRNSSAASRSGDRSRPYARSFTLIKAMLVPPGLRRPSAVAETKIRLLDTGLLAQYRRRPTGHDAALLEHVGAVGDFQRAHDVLLDEQDGHALGVDPPDGPEPWIHPPPA